MKISECLAKVDTDKITHHRYGEAYEFFFESYDRNAELNILEVGTQKGGSLQAWKEYFPNAHVYGVDIVDVVSEKYRKDNVTRIISDIKDWRNDIKWDIVIDDGSHYLPDIVYVIAEYIPKLNMNGVIVIEDVRFPDLWPPIIENILCDISIAYPNLDYSGYFDVRSFDNRNRTAEFSYIMGLMRKPL